jgi:hypothetical protein
MADQGWLLAQQALIEECKAEVDGMKASNKQAEFDGDNLLYLEDAFQKKALEFKSIYFDIMQNR